MGLDTTHDCWHGPYSSFNNWRRSVAKTIGIDLSAMVGFGGSIEWNSLQNDPLHLLVNHSDCDGQIEWQHCAAIADRLEAIIPLLPEDDGIVRTARWDAERFAKGLRLAAEKKQNVEFHLNRMSECTVYLIHFERPYRHARHYLGSAGDLPDRIARHLRGDGARLMQVITAAGIPWRVVRIWTEGGRELERKLKKRQHNTLLCPVCNPKLELDPTGAVLTAISGLPNSVSQLRTHTNQPVAADGLDF